MMLEIYEEYMVSNDMGEVFAEITKQKNLRD